MEGVMLFASKLQNAFRAQYGQELRRSTGLDAIQSAFAKLTHIAEKKIQGVCRETFTRACWAE
jgi:hypothetical protein